MTIIDSKIHAKAKTWLSSSYDEKTRIKVKELIENDPQELFESFYKELEFGTGGLRGVMGVGTNRMNNYTVGKATQGLANYLTQTYPNEQIKLVIGYDSRNNSREFAENTSNIFSANGFIVYLFEDIRPTPEISFAIRYLGCHSGVIITASHNPKEYNGYKAYWNDGGQLIPPHDKNVIEEVKKIINISQIKFNKNSKNIKTIGEEIDNKYIEEIKKLSLSPKSIKKQKDTKIVYTPLHGTGGVLIPRCLKEYGFQKIFTVEEQNIPNGEFPTVKSPNPEEPDALKLSINKAKKVGASLILATDPDADRVGIAIKNNEGKYILINGNQTACLLTYYLIKKWKKNKKLKGKEYIVKTIVTSELMADIAKKEHIKLFDVLTGFKWIANVIRENEDKQTFICGGEESYGFLIGNFVRDKDAVSACAIIAEVLAWAADQGKTLFDILLDIYLEYGLYKEILYSIEKKGQSGVKDIQQIMWNFRNHPPLIINGLKVIKIKDYLISQETDFRTNHKSPINLPISNVLQFFLEDESKISVRPSGTEPKIKFYFSVKEVLKERDKFKQINKQLDLKIKKIISDLNLE